MLTYKKNALEHKQYGLVYTQPYFQGKLTVPRCDVAALVLGKAEGWRKHHLWLSLSSQVL